MGLYSIVECNSSDHDNAHTCHAILLSRETSTRATRLVIFAVWMLPAALQQRHILTYHHHSHCIALTKYHLHLQLRSAKPSDSPTKRLICSISMTAQTFIVSSSNLPPPQPIELQHDQGNNQHDLDLDQIESESESILTTAHLQTICQRQLKKIRQKRKYDINDIV